MQGVTAALVALALSLDGAELPAASRSPGTEVNLLEFPGVDRTGKTSSSDAIQAALHVGNVYAPAGVYKLSAGVCLPSGRRLRGAGPATVFVADPAGVTGERVISNCGAARGAPDADLELADFAIRATTPTPTSGENPGMIRFEKVDGLSIHGIVSQGPYRSARTIIDLAGGVRNAVIRGNRLINVFDGGGGGALWVRGGPIHDPQFDAYNITIEGNLLQAAADEALAIYGWFNTISRVSVTGNVILAPDGKQVAIGVLGFNVIGTPQQAGVVRDVVVSGNVVAGKTNVLTGADGIQIVRNTIFGPTLAGSDAVLVSTSGVRPPLDAPPTNVVVSDNTIRGAARYGVFAGGSGTAVRGNRVAGTNGAAIYAGTGAVVDSNVVVEGGAGGILAPGNGARVGKNTVLRSGGGTPPPAPTRSSSRSDPASRGPPGDDPPSAGR